MKNLIPFKNYPFTLYEGQRFTDMVESIRDKGDIGMRVAEAVSFLKVENQKEIERELC